MAGLDSYKPYLCEQIHVLSNEIYPAFLYILLAVWFSCAFASSLTESLQDVSTLAFAYLFCHLFGVFGWLPFCLNNSNPNSLKLLRWDGQVQQPILVRCSHCEVPPWFLLQLYTSPTVNYANSIRPSVRKSAFGSNRGNMFRGFLQ